MSEACCQLTSTCCNRHWLDASAVEGSGGNAKRGRKDLPACVCGDYHKMISKRLKHGLKIRMMSVVKWRSSAVIYIRVWIKHRMVKLVEGRQWCTYCKATTTARCLTFFYAIANMSKDDGEHACRSFHWNVSYSALHKIEELISFTCCSWVLSVKIKQSFIHQLI